MALVGRFAASAAVIAIAPAFVFPPAGLSRPAAAAAPEPAPRKCPAEGVRTHTAAVPTSIDGTGATDVTVELEAWLQSLAPDTRAVLAADAMYRAEKPIRLERKQALTIDGNGARLLRTEPGNPDESKTRTTRASTSTAASTSSSRTSRSTGRTTAAGRSTAVTSKRSTASTSPVWPAS